MSYEPVTMYRAKDKSLHASVLAATAHDAKLDREAEFTNEKDALLSLLRSTPAITERVGLLAGATTRRPSESTLRDFAHLLIMVREDEAVMKHLDKLASLR